MESLPRSAALIRVDDARRVGDDPRVLRDGVGRGLFVRIRRGVYCASETWQSASATERHRLHVAAVAQEAHPPFLVAGRSAAAIWELPFAATWPDPVTLLRPHRGGGATEPGVRVTTVSADSATAAQAAGVPVTSLARTVLDVARTLDFADAVALIDHVMRVKDPHRLDREQLVSELRRASYVRGAHHLTRALEFASPLSGSIGESRARVAIHRLGFEEPELQAPFSDEDGDMWADFAWRFADVVAEFDGKVKYSRDEFSHGDPVEVLWREKKREDRLRRQVRRVARITTYDVEHPERLDRILAEAGVPRRADWRRAPEGPTWNARRRRARPSPAPEREP